MEHEPEERPVRDRVGSGYVQKVDIKASSIDEIAWFSVVLHGFEPYPIRFFTMNSMKTPSWGFFDKDS